MIESCIGDEPVIKAVGVDDSIGPGKMTTSHK